MRKVGGGGRREEHVRAWWSAIRPEGRRSGGEPASAHGYSTMERSTGKVLPSQLEAFTAFEHLSHGSSTMQHAVSSNVLLTKRLVPSEFISFVTNRTSGPSGYQVS